MKKKGINPFSKFKCKCRRRGKDGASTVGNMDDKITGSKELKNKMSKKVIMQDGSDKNNGDEETDGEGGKLDVDVPMANPASSKGNSDEEDE